MTTEPTLQQALEEGKRLQVAFLDAQARAHEAHRLYREAETALAAWQEQMGPVAHLLQVLK